MKTLNFLKSFLLLFACSNMALAQLNIASVAGGNWLTKSTWDCNCVPLPFYNITINNDVVLDTSFATVTGGSITINAGASLVQDGNNNRDLGMAGGSFTNNGTINIRYFGALSGTITNNDTMIYKSFYTGATFINNGVLLNLDSLYNHTTGVFTNNGTIDADSTTNAGTLTNTGTLVLNYLTNVGTITNDGKLDFINFTNTGTVTNNDTITGSKDFTNTGTFTNTSLGSFTLTKDFFNNFSATFTNNGYFYIGNNLLNNGTINGTSGHYVVEKYSTNNATFSGSFDFCDKTPPASSPYVDFNVGTIDANITYCAPSSITPLNHTETFKMYPNPTNGMVYIENSKAIQSLEIYNVLGEVISTKENSNDSQLIKVDLTQQPNGIYFVYLNLNSKAINKRIVLAR